jgi:PAS domain S-box-containing protein
MKSANSYSLLDAVPIGVFILDAELNVLFWNSTLTDWTGISPDVIVGQSIATHYPHLAQPQYTTRLQGVFQGGPPTIFSSQLHRYIIPIQLTDGEYRIQHTIVTAVENDTASYDAMFSIQDMTDLSQRIRDYRNMRDEALREVNERRQVEAALKASEARYRDLSELISDFAFALVREPDGGFRTEWVTDAYTFITGYHTEDFETLEDWQRMIPPDDIPEAQRVFQTLEVAWADEHLEHRIITRTGETRYMQTYLRPVVDYNKRMVVRIVAAAQDITRRKLAEAQLRMSEERFRQIAENLDVVIYIGDYLTSQITYANPAYEQVIGQSRRRLYSNPRAYLSLVHPDDRPKVEGLLNNPAHDQHKPGIIYRISHRQAGGDMRWIRERRIAIDSHDGHHERYIALLEDITNQRQANEREFALALEREQIQLLSSFITDATHEFRTPLSIINSSLYLVGKADDEAKKARYTTMIEEQVSAISELVDVLVLMAGLDSSVDGEREHVDVNSLFKMILEQFAVRIREKNLMVTTQFYGGPIYVEGLSSHLWQALVALLENAVRYTPETGKITLRSALDHNEAVFEITDTGIGITADAQEKIFERFYRGDSAHSTRGFGLGLPIARKIVEQHNGSIEVESEPHHGSVFRVRLPIMPSPSQ